MVVSVPAPTPVPAVAPPSVSASAPTLIPTPTSTSPVPPSASSLPPLSAPLYAPIPAPSGVFYGSLKFLELPPSPCPHSFLQGSDSYDFGLELSKPPNLNPLHHVKPKPPTPPPKRGPGRPKIKQEEEEEEDEAVVGRKWNIEKFKRSDFDEFDAKQYFTGKTFETPSSYLHHFPSTITASTPSLPKTQPRKTLVTRITSTTRQLIGDALDPVYSSATVPHQAVHLNNSFYVSVDGISQHVHSSKVGGCVRKDVVTLLLDKQSLGSSWLQWNLKHDHQGVGGIVAPKPKNANTTITATTTSSASTIRLYLTTLFSNTDSPPPTCNYEIDPYCANLMVQNSEEMDRKKKASVAADKARAEALVDPSKAINLDKIYLLDPDYHVAGHDYIGKFIRHHVPEHLVSIMPSVGNFSDCEIVAFIKPTRRKGPVFHVVHKDVVWEEDLEEEEVEQGLKLIERNKYSVSAHDLGFNVRKLKMRRIASAESESAAAAMSFDQRVEEAQGEACLKAIAECDFEHGLKHAKVGRKASKNRFVGVSSKQIWARIVAGLQLLGKTVDRRKLKAAAAALKAENAVNAVHMEVEPSADPAAAVPSEEGAPTAKKRGKKRGPKKGSTRRDKNEENEFGGQVKRALQAVPDDILSSLLEKGEESLFGVLFMLNDEGKIYRDDKFGSIVGEKEEWSTYLWKESEDKSKGKNNTTKTFTKWWSLVNHLQEEAFPDAKVRTDVFEQTMLISTQLDKLLELTPEHEELLKIESLPLPKKSQNSYELFCDANREKAKAQLDSEGFNVTAAYNNLPTTGYHREANVRHDGSKADIYYHTPDTANGGSKLRSKNDAIKFLNSLAFRDPAPENIPSIDDFDFSSPLISTVWRFPKIDASDRLSSTLKSLYDKLTEAERKDYEEKAAGTTTRYIAEIAKYRKWKQAKKFIYDRDILPALKEDSKARGIAAGRMKRKINGSQVTYSDTSRNMADATALTIRETDQASTLVDFERLIYMTDVSVKYERGGGMMDPSFMSNLRTQISNLLKKGLVRRVFSDPGLTDGRNFYKGALNYIPTSDSELRLRNYEIEMKRTEAILRRIIVTQLQVDPENLSSYAKVHAPKSEDYNFLSESDWITADCEYLKQKLMIPEGVEAEVISWCPEVDYIEEEDEDAEANAISSSTTMDKTMEDIYKGKVVTRRAMYKAKVVGEDTTVILNDFQVLSYRDAHRLRSIIEPVNELLSGVSNTMTSFKSKVGRKVRFSEKCTEPNGATTLMWTAGVCIGVDPKEELLLILMEGADEAFWGSYNPIESAFIREGDVIGTKVVFEGAGQAQDIANGVLNFMLAQPDSYLFAEPVDIVLYNIPHYPEIVTHPMDISTMQKKVNEGKYVGQDGEVDLVGLFWKDVALMFDNAILFNGEVSDVGSYAAKLKKKTERKILNDIKRMRNKRADKRGVDVDNSDFLTSLSGDAEDEDRERIAKSKGSTVEVAMKISFLSNLLPVVSETSKFSIPSDWTVTKKAEKKDVATTTSSTRRGGERKFNYADLENGTRTRRDLIKSLGLQYVSRHDFSTVASDRAELETLMEEEHIEMGILHNAIHAVKSKKPKEYVQGWQGRDAMAENIKKTGALAYRKGKTGEMVTTTVENFDAVKEALRLDGERKKREAEIQKEEDMFKKNFHLSWPPYLGRIGENDLGGLTWEIRKPFLEKALLHILRGLFQSGHCFEVEKLNKGGGSVCVANHYLPGVPFSILPKRMSHAKKRKGEDGRPLDEEEEEEEELTEYEKARAERVARNNAYLKSLGLA